MGPKGGIGWYTVVREDGNLRKKPGKGDWDWRGCGKEWGGVCKPGVDGVPGGWEAEVSGSGD